jgi:hypothetical protein
MVIPLKRNLRTILITISILILLLAGVYLIAVNGAPYKHALEFISRNPEVIEAIGKIETARLSFFGNYFVTTNPTHGHAKYDIIVHGEKGKGVVSLKLEKDQGKWRVVYGNLGYADGKNISLRGEK